MAVNNKKKSSEEKQYSEDDVRGFILDRLSYLPPETVVLDDRQNDKVLNTPLTDWGLDSLDTIELIVSCEKEFDVYVELDKLPERPSINNIVNLFVSPK